MGLIPLKVWIGFLALASFVALLFSIHIMNWETHPLMCEAGYRLDTHTWKTLWVVGHVKLAYPAPERICSNYEYDPRNTKP